MKYRNEKTNAVIDVKSKISGGHWKEEKTDASSKKEKQAPAKEKKVDKEDE